MALSQRQVSVERNTITGIRNGRTRGFILVGHRIGLSKGDCQCIYSTDTAKIKCQYKGSLNTDTRSAYHGVTSGA